jgi:predicted phage gp36 major capsid-like protein
MSAPQSLVQAALNRLAARCGSGLVDAAAGLAVAVQDAPVRLQQELQLFWEEVEQEAERLERGEAASPTGGDPGGADPQQQIDALRAQLVRIANQLDRRSQGQG